MKVKDQFKRITKYLNDCHAVAMSIENCWLKERLEIIYKTVNSIKDKLYDHEYSDVLGEILCERIRQDRKWGGPSHDDLHSPEDWVRWIKNYASWADQMACAGSHDKYRRRMINIAALASAAVQSLDRQTIGALASDIASRSEPRQGIVDQPGQ